MPKCILSGRRPKAEPKGKSITTVANARIADQDQGIFRPGSRPNCVKRLSIIESAAFVLAHIYLDTENPVSIAVYFQVSSRQGSDMPSSIPATGPRSL